jgi:hypothetical protein
MGAFCLAAGCGTTGGQATAGGGPGTTGAPGATGSAGTTEIAADTAGASSSPGTAATTTADPPVPDGATTATVVDPGTEPRVELRLAPHVGETTVLDFEVKEDITAVAGGETRSMPIPVIHESLELTPRSIGADGMITVGMKVTDASYDASADVPDSARKMFGSLVGMTGTLVMTPYGEVASSTMDSTGLDPQLKTLVDQLESSMKQASTPLPRQPVGVGGVWSVSHQLSPAGVTNTSTYKVTVMAIDGPVVHVRSETTNTVSPGPMSFAGQQAEVVSGSGTGLGTMVLDLGAAFPTSAHSQSTTKLELKVTDKDGTPQDVHETVMATLDQQSHPAGSTADGSPGTTAAVR